MILPLARQGIQVNNLKGLGQTYFELRAFEEDGSLIGVGRTEPRLNGIDLSGNHGAHK